MKPLLLIITFFILPHIYGQVHTGIKGGLNWTDVHSSLSNITDKARADFYLGGFTEASLNKKFLIRPELLYANKGSVVYPSGKGTLILHYITLPVSRWISGNQAINHLCRTRIWLPAFCYIKV